MVLDPREQEVLDYLDAHGASFFAAIHEGVGGGFPQRTVDTLWSLVWKGLVTNDTFRALRAFARGPVGGAARPRGARPAPGERPADRAGAGGPGVSAPAGFRSRRSAPAAAEGRWSLVEARAGLRAGNGRRGAASGARATPSGRRRWPSSC